MTEDNRIHEGEILFDPEELNRVRQVDAQETGRQFFSIDQDLNTYIAGHTQLINYDNNKAKALVFIDPEGKHYSLGNPSRKQTHYNVVDHPHSVLPIAEAGFNVANIVHNKGGAGLFALFQHPEITIPDTIGWDTEQYVFDGSSRGDDGLLHLSIALWHDSRTGKSIRLAAGYFRSICRNGLVSTILDMGSLRLTHNSFSIPKIKQFAENTIQTQDGHEFETFSPKVLEFPLQTLDQFQRDPEVIHTLPNFVRKPFSASLASQTNFFQDEIAYQMNLALGSDKDLTALDVLNMLTNVNQAAENDSLMFRVETISEAFVQLLEVSAFRMNIDFPSNIVPATR